LVEGRRIVSSRSLSHNWQYCHPAIKSCQNQVLAASIPWSRPEAGPRWYRFVTCSATGKRMTMHWRFALQVQRRVPRTQVDPNVLYVDEGDLLTSAGSASGLDLCAHLVRHDFGAILERMQRCLHELLEDGRLSIGDIAARAGLGTPGELRQ
jgi:hypothetical protein